MGVSLSAQGQVDRVFISEFWSPVGIIRLASTAEGLVKVSLPAEGENGFLAWMAPRFPGADLVCSSDVNCEFHRELEEYFQGSRTSFDFQVRVVGSAFTKLVLEETRRIPFGSTASYGAVAASIGQPLAARAVGRALAANPLPIVIPCHRVTGKGGSLVGFGGGLALKQWLLDHERRVVHGQSV